MTVTRAEWGEQVVRQAAQGMRVQAASLRRGDALGRERFTLDGRALDRQERLRAEDVRERTRQEDAAKAQAGTPPPSLARERGPTSPPQSRGPVTREAAAKETSSAAKPAVRTGGAGIAQADKPATGQPTGQPVVDAGQGAPEGIGQASAETAAPTETEGTPAGAADAAMAVPSQIGSPPPDAAGRQGAPLSAQAEQPDAQGSRQGSGQGTGQTDTDRPVRGGADAATVAADPVAANPTSDPAAGLAAGRESAGAAFATALSEAAASGSPGTSAPAKDVVASGGTAGTAPAAHPASAPSAAPPVPLGAVPMTIGLRSLAGTNRFEMRLDPVELGRIDVTLDIDKDRGTVSANLVVDSPATLALLARDADGLQQALAQAGFDAGEAGITLQLRGEDASRDRSGGEPDRQGSGRSTRVGAGSDTASLDAIPQRALRPVGGLDIRI